MNFIRTTMFLVLALLLGAPAAADNTQTERYQGIARSPDGTFLYKETHVVTKRGERPLKARTIYYDANGKQIGQLDSDFSSSPYAPSYSFSSRQNASPEAATVSGKRVTLSYGGRQKQLDASGDIPLVVGQGLHHYVRLNLERLAKAPATVRFAIPSRLDAYTFRIRPLGKPKAGVVRLRIEVDSFVLRVLAPHLDVDYELSSKRLLRYQGVSNVEGEGGATQQAIIQYSYGG